MREEVTLNYVLKGQGQVAEEQENRRGDLSRRDPLAVQRPEGEGDGAERVRMPRAAEEPGGKCQGMCPEGREGAGPSRPGELGATVASEARKGITTALSYFAVTYRALILCAKHFSKRWT